jgi:hypothetical protein
MSKDKEEKAAVSGTSETFLVWNGDAVPSEHDEMNTNTKTPLDYLADFASFINGAASLIVGHRAILIQSGMNPVVVDQMCYNLHTFFLGSIDEEFTPADFTDFTEEEYEEEDDEDY